MTILLKDMTRTRTGRVETFKVQKCKWCKEEPGLIYPDDKYAQKQDDGSTKCGKCVIQDLRMKIVKVTPNS